jgi:hypothetical protein
VFPSLSPSRSFLLFAAFVGLCVAASSALGATQATVPPALVEEAPAFSDAALQPADFSDFDALPPAEIVPIDATAFASDEPAEPSDDVVSPFKIDADASPFQLDGGAPPFRLPDATTSGGVQIFETPESLSDVALTPTPNATQAVETVKLDPYFSRSPSSWAMTSMREGRNSLFQSVGFEVSSAANVGALRCGLFEASADVTLGLPFPTVQTPLLVSPTFGWTQIETPETLPTPFDDKLSLFSQGLVFQYYVPINSRLLINVNFQAFYNTDYHSSAADAWFFNGYAAAAWKINPTTNLLFGVYHNPAAESWKTIPVGGLVWKPRDDFYLEAMIPYPKIAKRVDFGAVDKYLGASPHWIYLAGEVGGDIWAFETGSPNAAASRSFALDELEARRRDEIWAGRQARVRYFDFRIFAGIETKTGRNVDWALEAGVALARELSIQTIDGGPKFDRRYTPNAVGIIRFRASY